MLTNNTTRFLDQKKIAYYIHDLGTTEKVAAMEVSRKLQEPAHKIFKTILLSSKKGKPIAVLVPANQKVDEKKVAAFLGRKKVFPMRQDEAEAASGMQAGGISPLGLWNKSFLILADESINSADTVIISAGIRGWQIEMNPNDLLNLCNAKTHPISKEL